MRSKRAPALVPGVVIAIPAGVKHWHGAARDSWMQHLTYHTKVEEGASNEWCEPVTDGVYGKLPRAEKTGHMPHAFNQLDLTFVAILKRIIRPQKENTRHDR